MKFRVGVACCHLLCVMVLLLPVIVASQPPPLSPGWYKNSGAGGESSIIYEDTMRGLRITWENSYVYPYPGEVPLYWYTEILYQNSGSQPVSIFCIGNDLTDVKEHMRGTPNSGSVNAEDSPCIRNPAFTAILNPGEFLSDWVIFHNVPWIGGEVQLEWGSYGFSGWVDPWHTPFDAPPPDVCPPELVTLGTCQLSSGEAPKIERVETFREGVLVFFNLFFADSDGNAEGFGFSWNGGERASFPFSDPGTYGRVSYTPGENTGSVAYPFNHLCGEPGEYESDVEVWIYDSAGLVSASVTVHLACSASSELWYPNLQPTKITFNPSTAIVGGSVFFDSGVRNTEDIDTDAFNIKWFVNGQEVGAYGSHTGVPAGQTVTDDNSQFSWTFDSPGTYSVTFTVDVDNYIEESNEEDNSITIDVVVGSSSPEPQPITHTPGWYKNSGPSTMYEDARVRVVWENTYIYPHMETGSLYWYVQVEYHNLQTQPEPLICPGATDPSVAKLHIGGTEGLPPGNSDYIVAKETFCSRNPNFIGSLEPGGIWYYWVIFHGIPPEGEVALELNHDPPTFSAWVNPWHTPFSATPPAECPVELVTLGMC